MRNVDFFVDPEIPLRIRRLRGTMRSKAGGPVIFDDKTSFIIHIEAGRGGKLQFGKLLMLDAEMQIVDLDPGDSFRFDPDRYKPQLVAGYLRMLESGGLEVSMRDIDKIGRRAPTPVAEGR